MATTVKPIIRFDAKANKVIIELPVTAAQMADLPMSSSGKNKLLASAGDKVTATVHGKEVTFAINGYFKP